MNVLLTRWVRSLAALFLLFCAACSSTAPDPDAFRLPTAAEAFDAQHGRLNALLERHVVGDRVDYKGLVAEQDQLDLYLANLAQLDEEAFAALPRSDRYAFWINAYNASILRLIVANYPLDSIRDLGGDLFGRVWDKRVVPLGHLAPHIPGDYLSFSEIEHDILRPEFEDARVHAAINCASESCPPLRPHAFVGSQLEALLNEAMSAFINDPTRNHLLEERGELELSSIFDWFEEDFVRDAGSVRAYVQGFAASGRTDWIESADVSHLDYSWKLNDVLD